MNEYQKKINILSVSQSLLYEAVPHAGGKTYAYYMKAIAEDPAFRLSVICFCVKGEENKAEFDRFHAEGTILYSKGSVLINSQRIITDLYGIVTHKTALDSYYKHRQYLKALKKIKNEGYTPDIIILEWTCCVSLSADCRKLFPDAKIIGSEHDVTLLAAKRQADLHRGFQRSFFQKRAEQVKKEELEAISSCDIVMPHNRKDADLLLSCGVNKAKIYEIVPYYHDMSGITRTPKNKDILFWGAMSREENSSAALWFIEKVMPLIMDPDVRFVVIGNHPPKALLEHSSDRIIINGFVDDPKPYFENSLCFVAPLLTGAGIKVKVLEALSSGIPVLTNDIGIEGIPAAHGQDYFHCITPEDYQKVIEKILHGEIDIKKLCDNARRVISDYFNMEESKQSYLSMLKNF